MTGNPWVKNLLLQLFCGGAVLFCSASTFAQAPNLSLIQNIVNQGCKTKSGKVTLKRDHYELISPVIIPSYCSGLVLDLNNSQLSIGKQVTGQSAAFFMTYPSSNITIENGNIDGTDAGVRFRGYISGKSLVITSGGGSLLFPGMRIFVSGGVPGTLIVSGSGKIWQVNKSQSVATSTAPVEIVAGNARPMIAVQAPFRGLTLRDITFRDDNYTVAGVSFLNQDALFQLDSLSTTLRAPVAGNSGERTFALRELPPALHVGAYFAGTNMRPEYFVTRIDKKKKEITISTPISDSYPVGQPISFTSAASLTRTAVVGSTYLDLDAENDLSRKNRGVHLGQTVWDPSGCIPVDDRIVKADPESNTVVLERPLKCTLSSGESVAFASGISEVTLENLKFLNLGQAGRYQAATRYETAAAVPANRTMVFACVYKSCDGEVGLQPGDQSSSVVQGGLPANDKIVSRVVGRPAPGLYTVTLQEPLTSDVPRGTILSWQTSGFAGVGYGWYLAGYGTWFSNVFWREHANYYENVFSTSFFGQALSQASFSDDVCSLNFQQTTAVNQAGGGCGAIASSKNINIKNMHIKNAVGTGITIQRDTNVSWMGGVSEYNGNEGLVVCDVHGFHIGGGFVSRNNGQAANVQLAQTSYRSHGFFAGGLDISGSCGGSPKGISTDVSVGNVIIYDNQKVKTQHFGITEISKNGSQVDGYFSDEVRKNSLPGGAIDPLLLKAVK